VQGGLPTDGSFDPSSGRFAVSKNSRLFQLSVPSESARQIQEALQELEKKHPGLVCADILGPTGIRPSEAGLDGALASNQEIQYDFSPVPGSTMRQLAKKRFGTPGGARKRKNKKKSSGADD
jgi:hypothetical protein